MSKKEPINFSGYARTGNNAIDLVAQAAGYVRTAGKPAKAYVLKPASYDLFRAGMEVITRKPIDPVCVLTFEGVEVKKGGRMQFESLVIEYYQKPVLAN